MFFIVSRWLSSHSIATGVFCALIFTSIVLSHSYNRLANNSISVKQFVLSMLFQIITLSFSDNGILNPFVAYALLVFGTSYTSRSPPIVVCNAKYPSSSSLKNTAIPVENKESSKKRSSTVSGKFCHSNILIANSFSLL